MRLSVVLLVVSLAGVLGGGWLCGGLTGLGAGVVFESLCAGAYALLRDDGMSRPSVHEVHEPPTLAQVLGRARAS